MTKQNYQPSSALEERQLFAQMRAGDPAAVNELAVRFRPYVCYMAGRFVRSKNWGNHLHEMIAEGAVVLLQALHNPAYDPSRSRFSTFLTKPLIGGFRACARHIPVISVPDNHRAPQWPSTRPLKETDWIDDSTFEYVDALNVVLSTLARLPDPEREILKLRYYEGFDVSEVARMLKKTRQQVYRLEEHGLARMRELLCAPREMAHA